jgi:hypothetical protein
MTHVEVNMFGFKHAYQWLMVFVLALSISGCARYGKLTRSTGDDGMTIDELIENCTQYNIYYSGVGVNNLSGILFDPKWDDKKLNPTKRWGRINDQETLKTAAKWLKVSGNAGQYPYMRRILGPDGGFYGYLYSVWHNATLKEESENNMVIYDLPPPLHYMDTAPNKRETQ